MKDFLEKVVIAEAKIELLGKIISDLESFPEDVQDKLGIRRKINNYGKMKYREERVIQEALKCIQKSYPPADDQQ